MYDTNYLPFECGGLPVEDMRGARAAATLNAAHSGRGEACYR